MTLGQGVDPRLELSAGPDAMTFADEAGPVVGRAKSGPSTVMVMAVTMVSAVALFSVLNARRSEAQPASLVTPVSGAAMSPPESLQLPVQQAPVPPPPAPAPAAAYVPPPPSPPPPPSMGYSQPRPDPTERRRAPSLVVDLGSSRASAASTVGGGVVAAGSDPRLAQAAANTPEAFAARLSSGGETDVALAGVSIHDLGSVVPQGTIIPAVLETAINSDLPGYTRAVVSRDVRSFDGRVVLIPRGSRLVGQYKSALSMGQSRAFVIWTRVTRPDGVSVQISSPGTDSLGRGGLEGEVDRHFFSRFGGSILLSILNAGVASIGDSPSTQIAIGSPGAASAVASSVQGDQIPPTVKVAQGEAIRIFVSRDLDFSAVGPMR